MSVASVASYVAGQCTAFVAQTLSWVPGGLGNAKDWLTNAPSKGIQTSKTPAPGEVAVFPGYSSFGHVGIVKTVNADGTVTIDDMNWKGPFIQTEHNLPQSAAAGYLVPPGGASSNAPVSSSTPQGGVAGFFSVLGTSPNDFFIRFAFIGLGIVIVVIGLVVTFKQEGNIARVGMVAAA